MKNDAAISSATPPRSLVKSHSAEGSPSGVTSPAARSGPRTLNQKLRIPRSATPYVLAAVLAAGAMGWYFFVFVPQKLDYFVGLRFRTLAVASGQVKSKAESLGLSLSSARVARPQDGSDRATPTRAATATARAEAVPASAGLMETPPPFSNVPDILRYLRLLVPDIQLDGGRAAARASALRLEVNDPDSDPKILSATVAWDRVASQAALASASEFDDLVLADARGDVVWQREKTTPRLGNLKELLYAADDLDTMISPSWAIRTVVPAAETQKELPATATLKAVRVGATSTLMLVQAVHLESPFIPDPTQKRLYVAGFVSRNRLQQQAMRIPLAWLVAVSLPVAVLFLALPFIKLATMNAKERFSVANLILMAIGTIAAAGLAAVIPWGPRPVSDGGVGTLHELAQRVEANLAQEAHDLLALAKAVSAINEGDARFETCAAQTAWPTDRNCGLWAPLAAVLQRTDQRAPELDVAIVLDERGEQLRKWTTKAQLTGRAVHRAFEHFQNLMSGNLWSIDGQEFTIEPLRAPTTAEVGVVFAMPLSALPGSSPMLTASASASASADGEARFLALNVRLRSVVDVVMPPGHGFAIVAPNGKVLFHSNDGLSLEENFFEEVSNAQGVRERMRNERSVTWSGDYHGVPHRLHMQPVTKLQGCPWKIVTFQDLSPALAAVVKHQDGTFRLSLLNLACLVIVVLLAVLYTRHRGRDIRDVMTAPLSPDPVRLRGLAALTILAAVAIVATGRPWATQRADLLYLFFLLLPFAALAASVYARCGIAQPRDDRKSWLVPLELTLLVALVGAAPAAGFARLVQRVQEAQATERWLESALQSTVAHASRAHTRAMSPAYTRATRATLRDHPAFKGGSDPDALHFYLAVSPLWDRPDAEIQCAGPPQSGQRLMRWLLGWTMFSADRPGDTGVKLCAGANRLQVTEGDLTLAATLWPSPDAGETRDGEAGAVPPARSRRVVDVGWERSAIALLIFVGTMAAAYWARYRLVPPSPVGRCIFKDVLKSMAADGNQGIMLIGAPRMRKDQMVRRLVARHAGLSSQPDGSDSIFRIKLLDKTVTPLFVKNAKDEVSRRAKDPRYLDARNRLWIQVSNLEAQLISAERRTAVLGLLEQLMDRPDGEPSRVVVVTTTIDPIAHFHEIFTKELADIYDDEIPEVRLSRSSLVLSRFRRCYMPITGRAGIDPWWKYDETAWQSTLSWEAAGYPPLQEVAKAIKRRLSPRSRVSRGELARTFRSQALASYDLLWESCTRCEKVVLIQLAQEGFIATRNCEVVWGLINKGLIVERPRPTIFNNSFRLFLRHIERDDVVEQWEREDGNGLWVVAGRLIGGSLIAGGLFFLVTQDFSFDSLLPVVSGTGVVGAPVLRALLARVTTRGAELFA